ncbi:cytochrome P450 [Hyaloscypha hepaticicola]|uniref:Cytochrome P450 n=1 Tax=Hyaloscypha hepaticicola TaxID=2082293 RepID=A0A2J6QPH2_9HELO|nr:cytochrome P450 [Hyaloscypha hepaticicola]
MLFLGPIIRIGPNEVHIHDLEYFNQLLSFRALNKWAMMAHQFGISEALFGTEDYKQYTKKRAAFGDSFSRSAALKYQDLMNEHLDKACDIIKRRNTEGQTFNFIDDEVSTRGLYHRKHEVIFGLFHLGRHIYYLIPLLCDLLWQQIKQAAGGSRPKWSMLSYLSEVKNPSYSAEARKFKPVMATFMEAKLSDSDKTLDASAQQGVAVWSRGWETVGTTVTLGTYQVLKNPRMAGRLKFELKTAWQDIRESPSMEARDECLYLTALIKESLRFTSPPGRDYKFPPRTIISTSLSMVSMDPSIWSSDTEVFRPERWIGKENEGGKLDQWLVSFSRGTRADVTDDDILTYRDGDTGIPKNWCQRLPVWADAVTS